MIKLNGTWILSQQGHTGLSNVEGGRLVTTVILIRKIAMCLQPL